MTNLVLSSPPPPEAVRSRGACWEEQIVGRGQRGRVKERKEINEDEEKEGNDRREMNRKKV